MYSPRAYRGSHTMSNKQQQQLPNVQTRGRSRVRASSIPPPAKAKQSQQKSRSTSRMQQNRNVSAPVAEGSIRVKQPPKFQNTSAGDVIVTHDEYIDDLVGSVAFAARKFAVNPGLVSTFPWLSRFAMNYESYKFESLNFEYRTTTSTGLKGDVALECNYDPSDPDPDSMMMAMNNKRRIDGPIWARSIINSSARVDLSKRNTYLNRNGPLVGNSTTDLTLYDTCNLFIVTDGCADTTRIGRLFCKYRVKLMTPKMTSAGIGNALSSKVTFPSASSAAVQTGNAPLLASASVAGSFTLTSLAPYQCLLATDAGGTTLSGTTYVASGGAAVTTVTSVVNVGATFASGSAVANFTAPGQVITIFTANATLTLYEVRAGQYAFSLA